MKLLTQVNLRSLPALYATENVAEQDKIVQVKFFTPDSNWTWYAVEYNPAEGLFFGLVEGFEREWGYFTLSDMQSSRGPLGLPIERDLWFMPKKVKDLK